MTRVPTEHIPVLANSLVRQISLPRDAVVVDATTGHGGHSLLLGKMLGSDGTVIGFDVDQKSLDRAQEVLCDLKCRVVLIRTNFSQLKSQLLDRGIGKVDFILADLGFCSAQVSDPERGMSFQENMPLDMRLDDRLEVSASDIVNDTDEKELADIIFQYGEERASRRIARFIVEQRKINPIKTTAQLAAIVTRALGGRHGKIHPATKTFQALRIAVNRELEVLEDLLRDAPEMLKPGGQLAIITFHSLEDRIVKYNFRENKDRMVYEILTKKPLIADAEEIADNPRARSAKLRMVRRL